MKDRSSGLGQKNTKFKAGKDGKEQWGHESTGVNAIHYRAGTIMSLSLLSFGVPIDQ